MTSLHLFSKDLRIIDNEAIELLVNKSKTNKIILAFHLDDYQLINKEKEFHRSINAITFMFQCLAELNVILNENLFIISGDLKKNIISLKKKYNIAYISKNMDYTLYATEKQENIEKICNELDIEFVKAYNDQVLCNMEQIMKPDGTPYMTFSHFYNKTLNYINQHGVSEYTKNKTNSYLNKNNVLSKDKEDKQIYSIENIYEYCAKLGINKNLKNNSTEHKIIQGGRKNCLDRLQFLIKKKKQSIVNFQNRDDMSTDKGFNISPYLNFGCVSIREIVKLFNMHDAEDVFKQMVWRDFYLSVLRFAPNAKLYRWIDDRYNNVKWRNIQTEEFRKEWDLFINCNTGILLIDASMSELKQTGFMNNRARLLWATFAVKYMRADPFHNIYGAVNLFSRYLIDCSTSQNKMNFEWIISSLDIGGRRFSKRGESPLTGRVISIENKLIKKYNAYNYIRKWLPQYKDMSDKDMLKIEPKIDLKKRFQEYCNMFKK